MLAIEAGLQLLQQSDRDKWLADRHYETGSGTAISGGEEFQYTRRIVLNVKSRRSDWSIVAYHG